MRAICMRPGPTCESFADTKTECPTLQKLLKPRVASAGPAECLRRRSGTKAICEFNVTSICAYEALGSACLDPALIGACDGVMKRCGGAKGNYNKMSRESCEAGVSGIADSKRKKFISCISESCRFETCSRTSERDYGVGWAGAGVAGAGPSARFLLGTRSDR